MTEHPKLSKMQRAILAMAHSRRGQSRRNNVELYYAEILCEWFGFPSRTDPRRPGDQHFSRAEIGPQVYDAAQASLSRAVRRLEARGLVTVYHGVYCRWAGLALTDEGVRTAADLRQSEPLPAGGDSR